VADSSLYTETSHAGLKNYNKPFYSQNIFEKTNEILNTERKINDGIGYSFDGDKSEIKQMCQGLSKSLDELCGLIRDSIWNNREK
jgi:hypothetical protein